MAKFATHMGDSHGDQQTSPQHADPHGFLSKGPKSMWIGVLWAGLQVAMWITHVGGKSRHGLLEKHFLEDYGCGRGLAVAFLVTVGSFLLTLELFDLQLTILAFLLTIGAFLLTVLAFLLTVGAFLLTVGKCV